jgi:hypothetical protein
MITTDLLFLICFLVFGIVMGFLLIVGILGYNPLLKREKEFPHVSKKDPPKNFGVWTTEYTINPAKSKKNTDPKSN